MAAKEQDKMPISKVARTSRFLSTGLKVGGNYLKYYAQKALDAQLDKEKLDEDNASDIYGLLSELKGGALKAAQMLSLDQGVLPRKYVEKFQMAQYSAPPLSYPLVVSTFKRYLKKPPTELFETFSRKAVNAASIGQVHKASIGDHYFAVKVQYPGVADSLKNDLRLAKPLAARIMKVKSSDLDAYMEEVEEKLIEETDYNLELRHSMEISQKCDDLEDIVFPEYYPALSCKQVLTMDWIDGVHLMEWLNTNPLQEERNRIGQALWNFYNYQIHFLKKVHADPHPGNFLITDEGQLGIIDFGCVKVIPETFYKEYVKLLVEDEMTDPSKRELLFYKLEILLPTDGPEKKELFTTVFSKMIDLLGQPMRNDRFDFGNKEYFDQIYSMINELIRNKQVRDGNGARGSRDAIYINRTYFGLYNLLHELNCVINTGFFSTQ